MLRVFFWQRMTWDSTLENNIYDIICHYIYIYKNREREAIFDTENLIHFFGEICETTAFLF